jgi:hypothetical protein
MILSPAAVLQATPAFHVSAVRFSAACVLCGSGNDISQRQTLFLARICADLKKKKEIFRSANGIKKPS